MLGTIALVGICVCVGSMLLGLLVLAIEYMLNFDLDFIFKISLVIAILGLIVFTAFGIPAAILDDKKATNDCEAIGGKYQVVRTETRVEYNAATKTSMPTEVEIYGCVK